MNAPASAIERRRSGYLHPVEDVSDELLSVNETAQLLRVSATTVRNWAADGRLHELRTPGGHRRFRAADVHALARTLQHDSRPLVLVIDDDDAIRYVLGEALGAAGFRVSHAASGLLGLEALDRQPPALAIIDVMMPGIDGLQVMRFLEQFGVDVPILGMSALGTRVEERVRELGASAFLAKPFDVRTVIATCHELIAAHAEGAST